MKTRRRNVRSTTSSTSTSRVALALLAAAASSSIYQVQAQGSAAQLDDLYGSWSTGFGDVMTGPGFAQPTNFTFTYPNNTGIAYSFDGQGHFEEAQYRFNANGTEPHCVQAVVIWQHGNYTINANNSITLTPIEGDGRIQVQDPCASETNVITYYNQPTIMQGYSITYDINHNRNMLRLVRFDGAYLPRLYLYYQPPNMLPVQQLWTSEAYKSYEESQGRGSAGGRVADISGLGIMVAAGAALLGWSLVA